MFCDFNPINYHYLFIKQKFKPYLVWHVMRMMQART